MLAIKQYLPNNFQSQTIIKVFFVDFISALIKLLFWRNWMPLIINLECLYVICFFANLKCINRAEILEELSKLFDTINISFTRIIMSKYKLMIVINFRIIISWYLSKLHCFTLLFSHNQQGFLRRNWICTWNLSC